MLQGGSTFKKHFTIPFNEALVFGLAKNWGVKPDEIQKIWSDKGQSTADFGTGIHLMRELSSLGKSKKEAYDAIIKSIHNTRKSYVENKIVGNKILNNSKTQTENYARPTHTDILKLMKASDDEIVIYADKIESEFIELYKALGFDKYEAIPEAYVSYSKLLMGGEVDNLLIIDKERKTCRVQDYKVQGSIDEVSSKNELTNELQQKKASKLDVIKIQLSYYAYCLYKAGWTVLGGDVFARDGKWRHYKVNLIPMDEMDKLLNKYLKTN